MPAPSLRPRSPTEIVDAAFQLLRAHYSAFVTCSAIAYAPVLLLRLVVGDPRRFLGTEPGSLTPDFWWYSGVGVLVSWLTFSLMSAVLQVCTSQVYLGQEMDVADAVRQALPRTPQVLVAAVIRFVLMMIALMLLLFPVLYVVPLLFAVTPLIVLEQRGIWTAMGRSASLSKGRKWHILNTLGLVAIIYYLLVVGFSVVASLFGSFVLATVVSAAVTVLVYPVVAIAETLLYYDARIQSEGLDIELMSGALDAPPASPA
jgi:Membrane domain of glycerophosphoryl diester phosphodiesterase.